MTNLENRYGARQPIRRGWWIAGISLVAVVAAVWMAAVNFGVTKIETQDITHQYDAASREMSITWNVSVQPGTDVACALQVLNEQFQVVGWKVVDIPASNEYTRQFTETVRTAMTPNTGLAYRCWAS